MSERKIVETRKISTPEGILEVEMTQEFIDRVKQHYGIFGNQPLEDEHVRRYVWKAVDTAVSKAERELKDAGTEDASEGVR